MNGKEYALYLAVWIACYFAAGQLISSAAILVPVWIAISVGFGALGNVVGGYLIRRRTPHR